MSKEVLLVNPRRRSRTRRTAAQRAATRRLVASNRKRTPARRRRATRGRSNLGMYVANPKRRKRRSPTRARRRARYRRNPAKRMTMQGVMNNLVIPAATAGAGAVALDVLWGFVPLPDTIKAGPMRHVAKGLGAVVLGNLVGMFATKRMGDTMALGALTVVFHSAFREMTAQFAPQIPLGYYSAGQSAGYDPSLGYYVGSPKMVTARGESRAGNANYGHANYGNNTNMDSEMGYYVQEAVGAQY